MVTIGVSCETKLCIASVRFTLGGRSTIRNSTRSMLAISPSRFLQSCAGLGIEEMRIGEVEADANACPRGERARVEHPRDPIATRKLQKDQRFVAQRLRQAYRQLALVHGADLARWQPMPA